MAGRHVGQGARSKYDSHIYANVSVIKWDAPYPMDLPRLGYAVIVNNVASEFPGTKVDVTSLETGYKTVGFDVISYEECDAKEMREVKDLIMDRGMYRDSNCLVVTIICHGDTWGQLLDKDNRLAWVLELFLGELSDVETLIGKPKILVIQSYRGGRVGVGRAVPKRALSVEERQGLNIRPDQSDMFLAYSTVHGYTADPGNKSGSIYLQTFSRLLQQEYMSRSLQNILQMVRQEMIRKVEGKQVPQEETTLLYDVRFSEFHQPGGSEQSARVHEIEKERLEKKMSEMERRMREIQRQYREVSEKMDKELREMRDMMERMQVEKQKMAPQEIAPTMKKASGVTRRPVTLQLISSHNTDLSMCYNLTVMRQTGRVVVQGQRGSMSMFVFTVQGFRWGEAKVNSPCEHIVNLLGVEVDGQEFLAVSCLACKDIVLLNLCTQQVTTAFMGKVGGMCHGDTNRLYVELFGRGKVMELNTSSSTFSPIKTIKTGVKTGYIAMCYIPSHRPCLVVSDWDRVYAVACSNDQLVWRVEGEVDGCKIDPKGLLFLPQQEVLLVVDYVNERILVLDPSNGKHLQTIKHGEGVIYELCLYNNYVFMHHRDQDKDKISCFSVE